MKIELTKEEIGIINDLCYKELLEIGKIKHNKFIDKKQVDRYINKIQVIWDKMIIDN